MIEERHRKLRQSIHVAHANEGLFVGDAFGFKKCARQSDMVFAVAVLVLEHGRRWVGRHAARPQVHQDIADVLLHPMIDGLGLCAPTGDPLCDCVCESLDLRRNDVLACMADQ